MTRMTYQIDSHEITVRRLNGQIETVTMPCGGKINDRFFAEAKAANAKAGRGELMSYRNIKIERTESDAQYAERLADEAHDKATAKPRWQTDASLGFAGERDECSNHGSRRDPSHKED